MRTIFAIIGIITVVYFLLRGLTFRRKTLISNTEIEQSASDIVATLDTLSNKSLNRAMAELDEFSIAYTWEPWGKIVWQMPEVPNLTFEKNKTSVAAYSTDDSPGGLYIRISSIVDNDRVISDVSKSKMSIRLESPASDYERLLYAKLIEMGVEINDKE